jgi:hypothetical protein
MRTVGTCSQCGGPVTVPSVWGGLEPPIPTCRRCGAQASTAYGPIIHTERPKQQPNTWSGPYSIDSTQVEAYF